MALTFYSRAIALSEGETTRNEEAALFIERAACRQQLRDFEGVIADANVALALAPHHVETLLRRAVANESMQEWEAALYDYNELNHLAPGMPHVAQGVTRCLRRCAESRRVDLDDDTGATVVRKLSGASSHARVNVSQPTTVDFVVHPHLQARSAAVMAAACNTPGEASALGSSLASQGKYEPAEELYRRAIELSFTEPTSGEERAAIYASRAACRHQLRDFDGVVRDATAALAVLPEDVSTMLRRATAYEGIEKWQLALDDFNAVNRLSPGMSNAAQGIMRCQRNLRYVTTLGRDS
jgi:tetratricopeptide (TPR) repeat protein